MNIAALGTAISFAKFIFLPHARHSKELDNSASNGLENQPSSPTTGFWLAIVLLLGGLVFANVFYYEAYSLKNVIKPLATIGLGWLAYLLVFQKLSIKLPRAAEQFDHLIGTMSLTLILLFWMVLA